MGGTPTQTQNTAVRSEAVFDVKWSDVNGEPDLSLSHQLPRWRQRNCTAKMQRSQGRLVEGGDLQKNFRCPQTIRKIFCKYYPSLDFVAFSPCNCVAANGEADETKTNQVPR